MEMVAIIGSIVYKLLDASTWSFMLKNIKTFSLQITFYVNVGVNDTRYLNVKSKKILNRRKNK